ncbi:MAG TPA: DUF1800 domain-containing protein [Burkholderiaceae bacterium]
MEFLQTELPVESERKPSEKSSASPSIGTITGALAAAILSACNSGANDSLGSASGTISAEAKATKAPAVSANEASRFLAQAGFGGTDADIASVQGSGESAWLATQFAMPASQTNWAWMISKGFNAIAYAHTEAGIDASLWHKLMTAPDVLRQRIALALSELFVVSLEGLPVGWRNFGAAAYMDLLAANAFGNFRTLLGAVTLNPAMGVYLNTRGNQKEDPATGREADENYGREVMQLFTIGLVQLNNDGSAKLDSKGNPIPTYGASDVTNIAQVFTGWNFASTDPSTPDHMQIPMTLNAKLHSTSAKSFLGVSIAAGTDGTTALNTALNTLFNHPNTPAFVSKQLIQRLVTSNPSPAYIGRVAGVFIKGAGGVRGDMKSVISAILLDPEARPAAPSNTSGKLREPIIRLVHWARAFKAASTSGNWAVGDTSSQAYRLGQSPLRAPTVFNFFAPGYIPPNNALGVAGMVAPELQITNESTTTAYANFMEKTIGGGLADLVPDYSTALAQAGNASALFNYLNTLLAGGQLSSATASTIQNAVNAIAINTSTGLLNRVKLCVMLIMCCPEYIVQK